MLHFIYENVVAVQYKTSSYDLRVRLLCHFYLNVIILEVFLLMP